MPIPLKNADAD